MGAHIVNLDWVLPEIRFKGNAYGAWFRYDALGGSLGLGSYRDPHITRTLDVFGRSRDFVANASWSETDIGRAIIAVAKRGFTPLRPRPATGPRAATPPGRHHPRDARGAPRTAQGHQPPPRCSVPWNRPLGAGGFPRSAVCVVSSRDKLEQANAELGDDRLAIEEILQHG